MRSGTPPKTRSVAAILAIVLVVTTSDLAIAGANHTVRRGQCTGHAKWRIELTRKTGRIRVDYLVRHTADNSNWQFRLRHNDHVFFRGRVPIDFDMIGHVREKVLDSSGTDVFLTRAGDPSSGSSCRSRVPF